ncbi:MAG: transglutaminase domain-containing protein [Desulfobacterales bacterium]|nr:transglutaminase domain-containing protein [Desulfobacterales bacterium]
MTKPLYKNKTFRITGIFFLALFLILFSIRLDLFSKFFPEQDKKLVVPANSVSERNTWMNIFQNGRKIGFSHSVFSKKEKGYYLQETVFMRINTMGMIQDINFRTEGNLNFDFTLSSLSFEIRSGRFSFSGQGTVSGNRLSVKTQGSEPIDIKLKKKPYLAAGILDAVRAAGVKTGDKLYFDIFDPGTMSQERVTVKILGKENITNMGLEELATKVSMNFKGMTQLAWISEIGEVLKQEGMLGITLEKTGKTDALFGLEIQSSEDLTAAVAVDTGTPVENAAKLNMLKLEISGIEYDGLYLDGGRQKLEGNILTILMESLPDIKTSELVNLPESDKKFLKPTPFIQSDNKKIIKLAQKIVAVDDTPLEKAEKLLKWIHGNIEKRPVLSLPDAVSTLENRMGDCNEHSVLFAALARAAGIPAKIEAGLVYMDGRFYYHAWNLVYIGEWVTADSLFGQFPADVTHLRFASGEQEEQLDLMGVIGNIKLKVVEQSEYEAER